MTGAAPASPTDLVKVRMQADTGTPQTLRWHVKQIYELAGPQGFFIGAKETVMVAGIRRGTQLATYDSTKHLILKQGWLQEGLLIHALSAIIAGFATSAISSPIDLVRTRLMNFKEGGPTYNGFLNCGMTIARTEGLQGLYKGFSAQWLRLGPHTLLQFIIWENLRKMFDIKPI